MQNREYALMAKVRRLIKARVGSLVKWEAASGCQRKVLYGQKTGPSIYTMNKMLEPLGMQLDIVPIQYDLDTQHQPYNIRDK